MRIHLVTPANKGNVGGNRTTTERWATFLSDFGYDVQVTTSYPEEPIDLMIALHAWRNASIIKRFRRENPASPLVVLLTGTDIYKHLHRDPDVTTQSLEAATVLVGLHHRIGDAIPERFRNKVKIILQSASEPASRGKPGHEHLEVSVIAHLREEKDPLRTAYAARHLPAESAIRVRHLGRAYNSEWAEAANQETSQNPRYDWVGETDRIEVEKTLTTSHLLVISSIMEGGANVISEAIQADLPILASDIPGNVGLLGEEYAGYFPASETRALRDQLMRFERDPAFREELRQQCQRLKPAFQPETEANAVKALIYRLIH